jgi:hypothetical protein
MAAMARSSSARSGSAASAARRVSSRACRRAKADQGIGRHVHGLQLLPFVQGLRIIIEVQGGLGFGDFPLQIQEAFAVDLVPQHRVPRRALFLEFGKYTGAIGRLPAFGKLRKHAVAEGAALPEGNDVFFIRPSQVLIGCVGHFGAVVQQGEIVKAVQTDFGIGRRGFGSRAAFTDDQLPRMDGDVFVFQDVAENAGALDRHGLAFQTAALKQSGHQQRPFGTQAGLGLNALPAKVANAVIDHV